MADILELLAAELLKDQDAYQQQPVYQLGSSLIDAAPIYGIKGAGKVDPWESLLLGALSGFGGGALQGMAQAQQPESSTLRLAQALTGNDKLGEGGLEEAVATLYKQAEEEKLSDFYAQEKFKALAEAFADPKDRKVLSGVDEIQERQTIVETGDPLNPYRIEYQEIGRGPRFAPRQDTAVDPLVANKLAEMAAGLTGAPTDDPAMRAIYQNEDTARIANTLLSQEGIGERFKKNKEQTKRQTSLFGYEPIDDSFQLQASEMDDLRRNVSATQSIIAKLDTLSDKDLTQIAGQDAQTQAAISAQMFQAFRNKTGSGANLTKNEEDLINSMSPALAAGNLTEAIKRGMLGRDQKQFAKDLQGLMQEGLDVELFSMGLKRKTRSLDSYPALLRETMGITLPDQGPPTPARAEAGSSLEVPKRLPGESVPAYRARTGL